jgi:hypothetical protein
MPTLQPDTQGKWYRYYLSSWAKIDTLKKGEEAIKNAGELYLPKLSGQTPKEYESYLNRGSFFNAFSRTINGLTGAVMQKDPKVEASKETLEYLSDITLSGESINEVSRITVQNVLEFGYYGILIDCSAEVMGKTAEPYFAMYEAATILNFKTLRIGAEDKLMMLSLAEEILADNSENQFATISQMQVRVLSIEDGFLVVRLYQETGNEKDKVWKQVGEDITPSIRGKRLTDIPFVFFGAISNSPAPDQPPLIDLVNLNVKHWQVSADYFHGLHYCAMPTPWAAGFPKTTELYIGAMRAWVSEDPQANCGFLEFTGQGLDSIVKALDKLENQMAILGARMLEEQKKAAEAAETVVMRYSGDTATLSNIVNSVEQGLTKAIRYVNLWRSKEEEVKVSLNKYFVSAKLSSAEITALVASWQQGGISFETLFYNLQAGEIIESDLTVAQEKARIEAGGMILPENGEEETYE